jgi:hypothetical protein
MTGSGGMGGRTMMSPERMLSGGARIPGSGAVGGAKDAGKDDRRRYEFVVMLVWREPVPKIEPNPDAPVAPTSQSGLAGPGER